MSTIGIDCRFASLPVGIGRYTRELVTRLTRIDTENTFVLLVCSANEAWLSMIPPSVTICECSVPHYSIREHIVLPRVIRQKNVDVLFAPHFNVPYFCPVPFVCTVHDLILHHFPNQTSLAKRIAYKALMRRAIYKAHTVVAVSNTTKEDIKKTYGIDALVIYPGVGKEFVRSDVHQQQRIREKHNLPEKFLLYVGAAKQHKNVPMLLDAFSLLGDQDIHLVLLSGGHEAKALSLPDHVSLLGHVEDTDLPALYSAALGYVSASLYEGFGLPLLEAMACDCPVVALRLGSIPEICGAHAHLVEPTAQSLCAGMNHIVHEGRSEQDIIAAREYAKSFSWDRAASQMVEILS